MEPESKIIFYATKWCPDCLRARRLLDQNNIHYTWIDIDKDKQAKDYVIKVNNGNRSVPTIVFPDKTILVEPSNQELLAKINNYK